MYEELLKVASTTVVSAGELVQHHRMSHVDVAATKTDETDIVTAADYESERFIRETILRLRPSDGFMGEEGSHVDTQSGVTWVVDPVDGTTNFLYNIPQYAVSVAAVEGEVSAETLNVVAAAVFNPSNGDFITGSKNGGAYYNGKQMQVSPPKPLKEMLTLYGFSYGGDFRRYQAHTIADIVPHVRDVRRMGSAVLNMVMIANRQADVCVERSVSLWDYVSGVLFVEEAGGIVEGFNGSPVAGDATFAGHVDNVRQLQELFISVGGDKPRSMFK